MQGSIVRRKDRWYVVTELPAGADGRRQQKWHSVFSSKREAEHGLSELDEGRYVAPGKRTLKQVVREDWLPATQVRVRPTGVRSSFAGSCARHSPLAQVSTAAGSQRGRS